MNMTLFLAYNKARLILSCLTSKTAFANFPCFYAILSLFLSPSIGRYIHNVNVHLQASEKLVPKLNYGGFFFPHHHFITSKSGRKNLKEPKKLKKNELTLKIDKFINFIAFSIIIIFPTITYLQSVRQTIFLNIFFQHNLHFSAYSIDSFQKLVWFIRSLPCMDTNKEELNKIRFILVTPRHEPNKMHTIQDYPLFHVPLSHTPLISLHKKANRVIRTSIVLVYLPMKSHTKNKDNGVG